MIDCSEPSLHRSARQREREAAILTAAIAEFGAAGFEAARLEDIAARAGVAKGTLYLYFEDKATLFKAAVRSLIHPTLARLQEQVMVSTGSAAALLQASVREIYQEMIADRGRLELVRFLIAEGRRFPDLADFYHDEVVARGTAVFRMILWRGIATGEFQDTPAVEFPQLLLAPCVAASNWRLMFGERHGIDIERYAEAHVQFILRALKPDATACRPREQTDTLPDT